MSGPSLREFMADRGFAPDENGVLVVEPQDAARFVAALKAALAALPPAAWEGSTIQHAAPPSYPRRAIPVRR